MARRTIHDTVGSFGTTRGGVFVTFNGYAAEYLVRSENARFAGIVGALARSWAAQASIAIVINGTTIVDVAPRGGE